MSGAASLLDELLGRTEGEAMKAMAKELAVKMGYSEDRRKRKRQHRKAARALLHGGTLFNAVAPPGSIPWCVAKWHLEQARAA